MIKSRLQENLRSIISSSKICQQSRYLSMITPIKPFLPNANEHKSYEQPPKDSNATYNFAVDLLAKEQERLKKEIFDLKSSAKSENGQETLEQIYEKEVELGYTQLENHHDFQYNLKEPLSSPVLESLHFHRFKNFVEPRLKYFSTRDDLVGDLFPNLPESTLTFEIQFDPFTKWFGAYGHGVPPNWTTTSPRVTIVRPGLNPKEELFSLIMIDLDRPNLHTNSLEQWCHWFVANIPISKSVVFEPQVSKYMEREPSGEMETGNLRMRFPPNPTSKSKSLGEEIFPYIPVYPAHINPRQSRRYAMVLLQQKDRLNVQHLLDSLKDSAQSKKERMEEEASEELLTSLKAELEKFQSLERSSFLPLWKFKADHDMQVAGYGYFRSAWNLKTPEIFSCLGIHEPVYGSVPDSDVTRFVQRLENAKTLYADRGLEHDTLLETLTKEREVTYPVTLTREPFTRSRLKNNIYDLLNMGRRPAPSRTHMNQFVSEKFKALVAKREARSEKLLAKNAEKHGLSIEKMRAKIEQDRSAWRSNAKRHPGISSIAAVAIVKNKPNDPAKAIVGPLTKKVTVKRYRYLNY